MGCLPTGGGRRIWSSAGACSVLSPLRPSLRRARTGRVWSSESPAEIRLSARSAGKATCTGSRNLPPSPRPPRRGDRRRELIGSVSLPVSSLPEGLGPVRILSNLRYNEGNEITVGGVQCRRQALRGGVNEAGETRFGALSAEPAAVPPPSPRD